MFKDVKSEVTVFLEKNRKERDERRDARIKSSSAVLLQVIDFLF